MKSGLMWATLPHAKRELGGGPGFRLPESARKSAAITGKFALHGKGASFDYRDEDRKGSCRPKTKLEQLLLNSRMIRTSSWVVSSMRRTSSKASSVKGE